jgi:hypothetical protein
VSLFYQEKALLQHFTGDDHGNLKIQNESAIYANLESANKLEPLRHGDTEKATLKTP